VSNSKVSLKKMSDSQEFPKVTNANFASFFEKNVGAFYVTMADAESVEIGERFYDRSADGGDLHFGDGFFGAVKEDILRNKFQVEKKSFQGGEK
jgi:hypothetical protein